MVAAGECGKAGSAIGDLPHLRDGQPRPHIGAMRLDLTDEETAVLTQELHDIVESDRYPFSPRIRTLRAILAKLRPEPAREPLPAPKVYAPPRATAPRKTSGGSLAGGTNRELDGTKNGTALRDL